MGGSPTLLTDTLNLSSLVKIHKFRIPQRRCALFSSAGCLCVCMAVAEDFGESRVGKTQNSEVAGAWSSRSSEAVVQLQNKSFPSLKYDSFGIWHEMLVVP